MDELPDSFFTCLVPCKEALPLNAEHQKQFNMSRYFPGRSEDIKHLILARNGVVVDHVPTCNDHEFCNCPGSGVNLCVDCLTSLTARNPSHGRTSLSNGMYYGVLPPGLREMSLGSRMLLRSYQFLDTSRLLTRQTRKCRASGHYFCSELDTPLVSNTILFSF